MRYFCLTQKSHNSDKYYYVIADDVYASNHQISELEHLRINRPSHCNIVQKKHAQLSLKGSCDLLYQQEVMIGDACYQLTLHGQHDNYRLSHDDQHYQLNTAIIENNGCGYDVRLLLGPALIFNLALNQIYCLHASAFRIQSTTFIMMADSGTGKSTMAEFIDTQKLGQRIADDIVPINLQQMCLTIWPCFPQLKLRPEQQCKNDRITGNIIFLFAQKQYSRVSIRPIVGLDAIKKLIGHTVAARLYDQDMLKNHLAFCHLATNKSLSFEVQYNHNQNSKEVLYDLLYELC